MWSFNKNVRRILCSEIDDRKLEILSTVLKDIGAELLTQENTIVGSQDILWNCYLINNKKVFIISETYEGITLSGPAKIVDEIIRLVNAKME